MTSFKKLLEQTQDKTILDIPSSPPFDQSPHARITVDRCPRVSTCQICGEPIVKGTKRVGFLVQFQRRQFEKGAANADRWYVHPDCLTKAVRKEEKGLAGNSGVCFHCKKPLRAGSYPFYVGTMHNTAQLCSDCQQLRHYEPCRLCGIWYLRYRTSIIVGQTKPLFYAGGTTVEPIPTRDVEHLGKRICDGCAEAESYISQRMVNREIDTNKELKRKWDEARDELEDWTRETV